MHTHREGIRFWGNDSEDKENFQQPWSVGGIRSNAESFSQATTCALGVSTVKIRKTSNSLGLLGKSEATLSLSPGDSFRLGGNDSEDKKKLRQPGLFRGILSNTEYFVRSYQKQRTAQKQPRKIVYYSDIVYCINHDYNSLIRRAGICMKNGFRSFAKN